jgi:thioredoxin 1
MALAITDANYEEILAEGKPVVIDFWADWCGPCRMVGPIVEELADEYAGRVVVGKCDVDENSDIASKFGIRNIPTLLFFRDGALADRHVGYAPKSELVARVENLLK